MKFEQEYQENETNYEKYKDIIAKIDEEISVLNAELMKLNVGLATAEGESKLYAERALSVSNEIKRLEQEEEIKRKNLTGSQRNLSIKSPKRK